MTRNPILYSFRRCPYAMRARLAIASAGIECELREIVLRDKAPEFLEASPKGTVPVVVTPEDTVIEESLDVMHWALGTNDPERWLVDDPAIANDTKLLIERNDGPFKQALDHYKYPNRYENVDAIEARDRASAILRDLDQRLERQDWLLGEKPLLADFAILPFVRQFAHVDKAWFDGEDWANLKRWLEAFLASERFQSIMAKYPKWELGDPVTVFPAE